VGCSLSIRHRAELSIAELLPHEAVPSSAWTIGGEPQVAAARAPSDQRDGLISLAAPIEVSLGIMQIVDVPLPCLGMLGGVDLVDLCPVDFDAVDDLVTPRADLFLALAVPAPIWTFAADHEGEVRRYDGNESYGLPARTH
jgi:hypothetical protein